MVAVSSMRLGKVMLMKGRDPFDSDIKAMLSKYINLKIGTHG